MIKRIVLSLIILLLPATVIAAEKENLRPHWSLELKGGMYYPDLDQWSQFLGKNRLPQYAGTIAYKVLRQIEVGFEGGYIHDEGAGKALLHSQAAGTTVAAGSVTYEFFPLQAFVLVRGIFNEGQWIVPYVGGGWTRIYYRSKAEMQDTIKGSADGYHGRAGIQLLLDGLDESAANGLFLDYGIHHTYLFFEAQVSQALINTTTGESVNLGGTSFLAGLLFEF